MEETAKEEQRTTGSNTWANAVIAEGRAKDLSSLTSPIDKRGSPFKKRVISPCNPKHMLLLCLPVSPFQ